MGLIRLAKETKSKKFQGVYFRELENGDRSYFLRIRLDGSVKRIPIGKKSEGITEQFCNQEKARILNANRFGEDVAAQLQKVKAEDPTFAELVDYYLESGKSQKGTQASIKTLYKASFINKRKITTQDVQIYIDELGRTLKPSTIGLRYKLIRLVMRYAISRGKYKYSDPTVGIDLPKADGIRKRYLSSAEVKTLLEAVQDKPRLYLFVKMALCTGARIGTLMSVHENDIKPEGSVRLLNHKTKRWYTGFFDEETMALLDGRDGYVLARRGKQDKMPGVHQIQRPLLKILNELFNDETTPDDQRVVIHTLRHSVATQQVSKGVPIEVISKTLDHTSVATTSRIYAKIAPELVKNSVHGLWD